MSGIDFWIGANVINVIGLGVLVWLFWERRRDALRRLNEEMPPSVREQRRHNAIEATIDGIFYGLLLVGGLAMIAYALFWWEGRVPNVIPIGTSCIAVIYTGKAIFQMWSLRRRDHIADMGMSEAAVWRDKLRQMPGC